mgnify:CR=1 FL=1
MSNLISSKLKDVIEEQIDNRGKNPPRYCEYSNHPIIDNYLIKNTKYPNLNEVNRYLDEELFNGFLRGHLQKNDVLITLVGAGIGNVSTANSDKVVIIQNTIGLRTNESMDNEFLYYLLLFKNDEIVKFDRGSSQPSIRKTDLFNMTIEYPNIQEQKAIVNVLASFDNKIEANNKINKKLEELAKSLYKHWFVDFEFTNEAGKPYKSSGGKMVESELGLIPKNWILLKLSDVLNFERGVEPGSKNYNETQLMGLIPFFRVGDLNKINPVYIDEKLSNEKVVKDTDILVSFDGAIGRVGIGFNGAYSSGLRKIYSKNGDIENSYIYFVMKSDLIQDTINAYANGTTILHAGSSIPHLKVPFNQEIVDKFVEFASPILEKIVTNLNENKKLAEMRDLLLPKLMSGEIRLPVEE